MNKMRFCRYCGKDRENKGFVPVAGEAHHAIGVGFGWMGDKASDLFTLPLCRECHTDLHAGVKDWEALHGSQWEYVALTIHRAITDGVLTL